MDKDIDKLREEIIQALEEECTPPRKPVATWTSGPPADFSFMSKPEFREAFISAVCQEIESYRNQTQGC